jgi:methyl-accepting chemotaxis protein
MNDASNSLAQLAEKLKTSTSAQKSAEELAAAAEELSANTEEVKSASGQISGAIEEISRAAQVRQSLRDRYGFGRQTGRRRQGNGRRPPKVGRNAWP